MVRKMELTYCNPLVKKAKKYNDITLFSPENAVVTLSEDGTSLLMTMGDRKVPLVKSETNNKKARRRPKETQKNVGEH